MRWSCAEAFHKPPKNGRTPCAPTENSSCPTHSSYLSYASHTTGYSYTPSVINDFIFVKSAMIRIPTDRPPTHPGEMLLEEFLNPMRITQRELAEAIHVPYQRINEIINGKRGVTPSTALRLAKYFNTSADFWMNLQQRKMGAVRSDPVRGAGSEGDHPGQARGCGGRLKRRGS